MSVDSRLAIHAIVDKLVSDGETFDSRSASELIERLPLSPKSSRLQFRGMWPGSSSQSGYAAGVGQSSVSNDEDKAVELGADRRWRIGGYKIEHEPGLIEISALWEDTLEDASGQACQLTYDRASRRPLGMYLARDHSVAIGPLHITYWRSFDPWKRPV